MGEETKLCTEECEIISIDTPFSRRGSLTPHSLCVVRHSNFLLKTIVWKKEKRITPVEKPHTTLACWSKITSTVISHVDSTYPWCDVMWHIATVIFLPSLIMKKHHTNSCWGTIYKIPGQYSSKLSTSSKQRKSEKLAAERSLRRHDK